MSSSLTPIVLVPAAGKGQRFKDAGYEELKPFIRFSIAGDYEKLMLDYALWGTQEWDKIVGLPEDCWTSSGLGPTLPDGRYLIRGDTTYIPISPNGGQLDTVWSLTEHVPIGVGQPILILNSDVSFRGGALATLHHLCSSYNMDAGAIVVEREDENKYSFVDDAPMFWRAGERKRLSQWALAGAYWFRDVHMIRGMVRLARGCNPSYGGEHYLSEVFEWLGTSFALPVRDEDYLEFGTPELLKATIERFK